MPRTSRAIGENGHDVKNAERAKDINAINKIILTANATNHYSRPASLVSARCT